MTHSKNWTGSRTLSALDLAAALGLVSLGLYVRTLAPGLLPGDSGEFQTLASLLGHSHPTGYPVYLALAQPLTRLPLGEIAWRVRAVQFWLTKARSPRPRGRFEPERQPQGGALA